MADVLAGFPPSVTAAFTAGLLNALHGLSCLTPRRQGKLAGNEIDQPWKNLLSETSKTPSYDNADPDTAAAAAKPLKALLLRVGTMDRIALGEVMEIRTTQSAAAALEALADYPASVLVADTSTSDFETKALLRDLRDPVTSPRKGLAVICLLAESSPERVRGLVKAGVDHVMIKPISATALHDLAQHLRDNPMQ